MRASWMPGRAEGLRARPSAAAAVALACAIPQTAEAIAMAKPEVMATQLTVEAWPACANAGTARHSADGIMNTLLSLRIECVSSYQIAASGWLTSSRADALTLMAVKPVSGF